MRQEDLKLKKLNSTQSYLSNETTFIQIRQSLIFDHIWASRVLQCAAFTADTLKYKIIYVLRALRAARVNL